MRWFRFLMLAILVLSSPSFLIHIHTDLQASVKRSSIVLGVVLMSIVHTLWPSLLDSHSHSHSHSRTLTPDSCHLPQDGRALACWWPSKLPQRQNSRLESALEMEFDIKAKCRYSWRFRSHRFVGDEMLHCNHIDSRQRPRTSNVPTYGSASNPCLKLVPARDTLSEARCV